MSIDWLKKAPIIKTLGVCTGAARQHARIELYWTVGFALLALPVVLLIVLFSKPIAELPAALLSVVGRGELMIYAASVCGAALYSLRHGIEGPIPDALKHRVTPLGTLGTCTSICLVVALVSYVVRRMGEIHNIPINDPLLNWISLFVLAASLLLAYVILALKFALSSGAAPASHEQTASFSQVWEQERNA